MSANSLISPQAEQYKPNGLSSRYIKDMAIRGLMFTGFFLAWIFVLMQSVIASSNLVSQASILSSPPLSASLAPQETTLSTNLIATMSPEKTTSLGGPLEPSLELQNQEMMAHGMLVCNTAPYLMTLNNPVPNAAPGAKAVGCAFKPWSNDLLNQTPVSTQILEGFIDAKSVSTREMADNRLYWKVAGPQNISFDVGLLSGRFQSSNTPETPFLQSQTNEQIALLPVREHSGFPVSRADQVKSLVLTPNT